ncbi:citrulline utilization hydrolase CtlX [Microbacter margulisiae]|uniref:Amidinotransferase n=1 Tax=Microbacter margulisiae TaxID=1350067 RepID=A0A7W5DR09_9PORP|nr:arginine deiminase-related protein [Microbacter margulisiae]MBB3187507.1 hypothetical protein [Microbacter margulisiae]
MPAQNTDTFLMVSPVAFGFNTQTSVNNYFQQKDHQTEAEIQYCALAEFENMVIQLRSVGLTVFVVQDTLQPYTPDSIFPNNWISFHEGGKVFLYPMFAQNRRQERRNDIIQYIQDYGIKVNRIDDLSHWENQGHFLEGTGSMVFDRVNCIAYAALSERTEKSLFLHFCSEFNFKPVCFSAFQVVGKKRLPVYHTNVVMSVADAYAVICLDCIDDAEERRRVVRSLKETGKEIISISEEQMHYFAGNMLQVRNLQNKKFMVLSSTAFQSLEPDQIERLKSFNELLVIDIPTIEKIGGGSVRCMMAEIF